MNISIDEQQALLVKKPTIIFLYRSSSLTMIQYKSIFAIEKIEHVIIFYIIVHHDTLAETMHLVASHIFL
jgi:hypothetical protein